MDMAGNALGTVWDLYERYTGPGSTLDIVDNSLRAAPPSPLTGVPGGVIGAIKVPRMIKESLQGLKGSKLIKEGMKLSRKFAPDVVSAIQRYVGEHNPFGGGGIIITGQPVDQLANQRAITSNVLRGLYGGNDIRLYRVLRPDLVNNYSGRILDPLALRGLSWTGTPNYHPTLSNPVPFGTLLQRLQKQPWLGYPDRQARNIYYSLDRSLEDLEDKFDVGVYDIVPYREILAAGRTMPDIFPIKSEDEFIRLPPQVLGRIEGARPVPPEERTPTPQELAQMVFPTAKNVGDLWDEKWMKYGALRAEAQPYLEALLNSRPKAKVPVDTLENYLAFFIQHSPSNPDLKGLAKLVDYSEKELQQLYADAMIKMVANHLGEDPAHLFAAVTSGHPQAVYDYVKAVNWFKPYHDFQDDLNLINLTYAEVLDALHKAGVSGLVGPFLEVPPIKGVNF